MIKSFRDKETAKIFDEKRSKKLLFDIQYRALKKLIMLDASPNIESLRAPPSNHLEKLSRDYKGFHSIRINDQWRVVFRWKDENAFDVGIVDYH